MRRRTRQLLFLGAVAAGYAMTARPSRGSLGRLTCTSLRFDVDDSRENRVTRAGRPRDRRPMLTVRAYEGDREVGVAILDLEDEDTATVGWITLLDDVPRRCGYGTQIYEKLQALACEEGRRLGSDILRTEFSEGFWRKQVRKGRAECAYEKRDGTCRQYEMLETCPTDRSLGAMRSPLRVRCEWPFVSREEAERRIRAGEKVLAPRSVRDRLKSVTAKARASYAVCRWHCEGPLRAAKFVERKAPRFYAIVHPSTKSGKWQVSHFDERGPVYDTQHESCDDAAKELPPWGWKLVEVA